MPVTIKGSGGGSVTLDAGTAASDTTLTLPNVTGTLLQSGTAVTAAQGGTGVTSTGAAGNVLFTTDGSSWSATQKIVQGTAVSSTSGTSIDFTGIPSWVKRVTVMLNGVSTTGTSSTQIQLGTSGGFVTSGYASNFGFISSAGTVAGTTAITTGLTVFGINANTDTVSGVFALHNLSGNVWAYSGVGSRTGNVGAAYVTATPQTLSSALTQIRFTTVNGTDTFDAGSINLLWE